MTGISPGLINAGVNESTLFQILELDLCPETHAWRKQEIFHLITCWGTMDYSLPGVALVEPRCKKDAVNISPDFNGLVRFQSRTSSPSALNTRRDPRPRAPALRMLPRSLSGFIFDC